MRITLKVTGANEVIQSFRRIGQSIGVVGNEVMKRHMERAMEETRTYPQQPQPRPPGGGYVRTYKYFKSFRVIESPFAGGAKVAIESDAVDRHGEHYSALVGGDYQGQGQRPIHVGRWKTLYGEVNRAAHELLIDMDEAIKRMIRGHGLEAGDHPGQIVE